MGPIHTNDGALVHLLLSVGISLRGFIIIDEVVVIIIGEEVHSIVLQVVVIVTEIRVRVSGDVFSFILG